MSGRTAVTGERRSPRVGRALAAVAVVVSVVVAGLTATTPDSADAYSVGTAAWSNTIGFNTTATQTMPSGVVVSSQVAGAGVQNRGVDTIGGRGGTAAMFTPGVVTRPAIAVAPMGDGCTASAGGTVCSNRGTWTVSFSQPVTNPVLHFEGFGANDTNNFSTILVLTSSAPAGAILSGPATGATNLQVTGGNTIRTVTAATNTNCTDSPAAGCGSVTVTGTVTTLTFRVDINAVGSGTNGADSRETWNFAVTTSEDFSDAPASYNPTQAPVHIVGDLKLGATIDADNPTVANSITSPFAVAAGADNNGTNGDGADEDAFTTLPTVPSTGTYALTVPLSGASKAGQVCGWVDFDKGGTFNTTAEQACAAFAAGATSANLSWTVPAGTTPGNTYARFRAAYGTVVGPTGREDSGEVEDYRVAIAAVADLAVTKTDGKTLYTPGTNNVYTVTVTNNGPSAVTNAPVSDPLPSGITASNWICSATAGGSCGAVSGSGAITSTVSLPVGGVATYTITMAVPAGQTGALTNTFTANTPAGVTDPTPGNNSASDTDQPVNPGIAIDKSVSSITDVNGNSLDDAGDSIAYSFLVTNTGNVTLTSVGVNDPKVGAVSCPVTVLAPGASTTCSASYTITTADASAGSVTNTATSQGTPPTGPVVISAPDSTVTPTELPVGAVSCTASTIYGTAWGVNGGLRSIDVSTGVTTLVAALPNNLTFANNPNALAMTAGGTQAWFVDAGNGPNVPLTTGFTPTLRRVDLVAGTITPFTGAPLAANLVTYFVGGGINPTNGIYYYYGTRAGTSNGTQDVYAFNTTTNTSIGYVGSVTGFTGSNGDLTFDSLGNLYMVISDGVGSANQSVVRVEAPSTTAQPLNTPLPATLMTTLQPQLNINGITFNGDGYLYVTQATSLYKLDPNNGSLVATIPMSTGSIIDAADCDTPGLLSLRKNVTARTLPSDQFTYTITGGGASGGNTATTTGSATGLQAPIAGPILGVPNRVYTLTETAASGTLSNYTNSVSCANLNNGLAVATTPGAAGVWTITFPAAVAGQPLANIECTITNTPKTQPPFTCTGQMYLMQSPNGVTNSTLYRLNTASNPFTYPALGQGSTTYNAIGYNPADDLLYGILNVSGSGDRLIRVGQDGSTVDLGAVSGLPTGFFDAGVIGTDGFLYVAQDAVTTAMYRINLTTRVATTVPLSASTGDIRDLAWVGGTIYTVTSAGQLLSINPTTGAVATIGAPSGGVLGFGALWGAPNGLFATENSGTGFYQFNLVTGARTLISGSPAATLNDGANCPTANIIINTDLSVTKTDGKIHYVAGSPNVYTVTVTNNGPFGIVNAPVSDPLPSGIATSSWICSTTAGGSCGAASGTGAITSTVSLPVNGVATYTITMPIPAGRTGDLTNTFTANLPPGYTDPTPANNTASDTDTPLPTIDLQIEKIGESEAGTWVRMDGSSFAILTDDNGQPGTVIALTIVDVSTGLFQIDDMPEGTYWLSELTAPDGFSLLAEPAQFVISSAGVVSITANGGGLVTAEDDLITVRDVPAMELPATGGTGSMPFVVSGVLLVLFAGVLALILWRRNRRTSESPHDIDT